MNQEYEKQHLSAIINNMHDALLVIDSSGAITLTNPALEELTGYSRLELIGSSCTILRCDACESVRSEGRGRWCHLFDQGKVTKKRCLIMRKDGTYLTVLKNASLVKDTDGKVLGAVETIIDLSELDRQARQIEHLCRLLEEEKGFHGLVGTSTAMRQVIEITEKAAQSDAPVIIYGESGTGKELVAQAIHELGRRREGPYIQLHCAALNEALLESELFGHVKGAFTGAYNHRQGRFEASHGGDIFLDEIGDVPLSIQVKLLRVLETKQFERVGDHRPITIDVRIIAATHRHLERLVAQGQFREDLFFRLNVIPIYLPPLRQRREDLPLVIEHFIGQLRRESGKEITGVTPEAMARLMTYTFPGNVRELKSFLEYAFVLSEGGLIRPEHLPGPVSGQALRGQPEAGPSEAGGKDEKAQLLEVLRQCKGNQTRAAALLGISRVTLWHRLRKYGIDVKRVVIS
jgi:PAS domain S-box-containing protein